MNAICLTEEQIFRLLEYGTVNAGKYLLVNVDEEGG